MRMSRSLQKVLDYKEGKQIRSYLKDIKVASLIEKGIDAHTLFCLARNAARFYVHESIVRGRISCSQPKEADIPSIHIARRTVPEAWEDTIMTLLAYGQQVHTGYDPVDKEGRYTSFPSQEGTVMMHIEEPFGEPRFHKHFLGGWMGFGDYRAEIEGVKDHWMISPEIVVDMLKKGRFDEIKDNKKWKYTYHQRLAAYPYIDIHGEPQTINQFNSILKKLKREPLSKSAICHTWDPRWDHNDGIMGGKWDDYDSACLQNLWFRLIPVLNESQKIYGANLNAHSFERYRLNMNWLFRSRDHLKAVPQNIDGLSEKFYEPMRASLEKRLGVPVERGRLVDISYSLHLYGHYFDYRKQGKDAEAYIQDIFRVASGEPIEKRLVLPGTPMYDMMMEDIQKEYKFRKKNPNAGLSK